MSLNVTLSNSRMSTADSLVGRVFPRLLALLLLVAAVAKAWPTSRTSGRLLAEASVEIALAAWLLSGVRRAWALGMALLLFIGFAAVSLAKIYQASRSCGCFGPVAVPPIYTFLMDIGIIASLAFVIAPLKTNERFTPKQFSISLSIAAIGLAALFFARHKSAPNVTPASPTITQTSSSPEPPDAVAAAVSPTQWLADLGPQHAGKTLRILFRLTDPADHDLQIRGVNISCGCTSLPVPPQVIHRAGVTEAVVIVQLPKRTGAFNSSAMLTTDSPQLPPLELRVAAQIK